MMRLFVCALALAFSVSAPAWAQSRYDAAAAALNAAIAVQNPDAAADALAEAVAATLAESGSGLTLADRAWWRSDLSYNLQHLLELPPQDGQHGWGLTASVSWQRVAPDASEFGCASWLTPWASTVTTRGSGAWASNNGPAARTCTVRGEIGASHYWAAGSVQQTPQGALVIALAFSAPTPEERDTAAEAFDPALMTLLRAVRSPR